MQIQKNQSLKQYNTLGFDQRAEYFVSVSDDDTLNEALDYAKQHQLSLFVIGGGSNLVLTRNIKGLVLHCAQRYIKYTPGASGDSCTVAAGAGVPWHELVLDTLANGAPGLENLSLIPGQVGAAPVQNIGAYGVELKDRMHSLRALHLPSRQWHTFAVNECQFEYRDSMFKRKKNEFLINEVIFDLGTHHGTTTEYASLSQHLDRVGVTNPTADDISKAVITIRQSRLPDPNKLGNVGSFFHNPIVKRDHLQSLRQRYPKIVSFDVDSLHVKLSAAWMIDTLGYRGIRKGDVGVYDKQALVLVNHRRGSENGRSLVELADEIREAVDTQFNVKLNIEPLVI
ncbi:MAG: UDP-N-acetylmuramate dehydrogenase [Granulosicoccus sp.]|nr:UDP-N-acetylmuramate dehydrogenase [Granulosicoccus sp.]